MGLILFQRTECAACFVPFLLDSLHLPLARSFFLSSALFYGRKELNYVKQLNSVLANSEKKKQFLLLQGFVQKNCEEFWFLSLCMSEMYKSVANYAGYVQKVCLKYPRYLLSCYLSLCLLPSPRSLFLSPSISLSFRIFFFQSFAQAMCKEWARSILV